MDQYGSITIDNENLLKDLLSLENNGGVNDYNINHGDNGYNGYTNENTYNNNQIANGNDLYLDTYNPSYSANNYALVENALFGNGNGNQNFNLNIFNENDWQQHQQQLQPYQPFPQSQYPSDQSPLKLPENDAYNMPQQPHPQQQQKDSFYLNSAEYQSNGTQQITSLPLPVASRKTVLESPTFTKVEDDIYRLEKKINLYKTK